MRPLRFVTSLATRIGLATGIALAQPSPAPSPTASSAPSTNETHPAVPDAKPPLSTKTGNAFGGHWPIVDLAARTDSISATNASTASRTS